MKKITTIITYTEFESIDELSNLDQKLIRDAEKNLKNSYSPYSLFKVSSAISLSNSQVVFGTNQENAAYPSGLCAERVAVFSAMSSFPASVIETVVIVTEKSSKFPFTPCGSCRQVLMEFENKQKKNIRVLLKSGDSKIWIFESIKEILPFAFDAEDILKKE